MKKYFSKDCFCFSVKTFHSFRAFSNRSKNFAPFNILLKFQTLKILDKNLIQIKVKIKSLKIFEILTQLRNNFFSLFIQIAGYLRFLLFLSFLSIFFRAFSKLFQNSFKTFSKLFQNFFKTFSKLQLILVFITLI